MLKRINDVLPELILEILIYGIVVQLVGIWFVKDKIGYSIGLWLGIAIAMGLAVHMAVVIRDTVDTAIEKKVQTRVKVFSILRYVVVVILFAIVLFLKLGNVIMMFVGVMGLKVAAYLQPFTHKLIRRLIRR